jgi:hypothetical protein
MATIQSTLTDGGGIADAEISVTHVAGLFA